MQTAENTSGAPQVETPAHLVIEGLVAQPQELIPQDVASLPRVSVNGLIPCDHRPDAGNQDWAGISLAEVLRLAQPQPEARYVRVYAQDYCVPFALDEIEQAILVESLDGVPLSKERGAPWRLFVPGAQCHVNVKWVDRLELSASRGASMEERAERARQRGRMAAN